MPPGITGRENGHRGKQLGVSGKTSGILGKKHGDKGGRPKRFNLSDSCSWGYSVDDYNDVLNYLSSSNLPKKLATSYHFENLQNKPSNQEEIKIIKKKS